MPASPPPFAVWPSRSPPGTPCQPSSQGRTVGTPSGAGTATRIYSGQNPRWGKGSTSLLSYRRTAARFHPECLASSARGRHFHAHARAGSRSSASMCTGASGNAIVIIPAHVLLMPATIRYSPARGAIIARLAEGSALGPIEHASDEHWHATLGPVESS